MPGSRIKAQRRPEVAQRKRLNVYMDEELFERLQMYAVLKQLTDSGAARELIYDRLAQVTGRERELVSA